MRTLVVWNAEAGFLKVDVQDDATDAQQLEAANAAVDAAVKRLRDEAATDSLS
jgi:hypothetical protein